MAAGLLVQMEIEEESQRSYQTQKQLEQPAARENSVAIFKSSDLRQVEFRLSIKRLPTAGQLLKLRRDVLNETGFVDSFARQLFYSRDFCCQRRSLQD